MMKFLDILIAFIVIVGCGEFAPTEQNYVDVEAPETILSVDLETAADTLYAFGALEIRYNTDLQHGEFAFARVYFNDAIIDSIDNDSVFVFGGGKWEDGSYRLRVEVWAHTQSSSLAGFLGEEFILAESRAVIVVVANSVPAAGPKITSIELSEGRLGVSWERFMTPGFRYYNIDRVTPAPSTSMARIYDWQATHWIDSSYVGGPVTYRVYVQGNGFYRLGAHASFDGPVSEIKKAIVTENHEALLEWSRCVVDSNFTHYRVLRSDEVPVATLTDIEQTTYVDTLFGFGETDYRVVIGSRDPDYRVTSPSRTLQLGSYFPFFQNIWYLPQTGSYYVDGNYNQPPDESAFFRIDASSFTQTASVDGVGAISADGNLSFLVKQELIYRIDPLTFEILDVTDPDDIVGYDTSILGVRYLISNNGHFVYRSRRRSGVTLYGDWIRVLNMNTKSYVGRIDDGRTNSILDLDFVSNDGRYIIVRHSAGDRQNHLYELRDGEFVQLLIFGDDEVIPPELSFRRIRQFRFCFFEPGDGETYLILTDSKMIRILRLPDLSPSRQFDIGDDLSEATVDPTTSFLGGYTPGRKYRIYNLDTGELVKEFNIAPDYSTGYVLLNSTIFSKNGLYMQLEY
jgi:hypothetical protein